MAERRWYVGVDWAAESHRMSLVNAQGEEVENIEVAHEGVALSEWIDRVLQRAEGAANCIAVAIETPQSAVVEMLMERGIAVYAINPKQLDRLRDRFTMAGAKDDRRDAYVLAATLRTDEGLYRLVRLGSERLVVLRELVRVCGQLQEEVQMHGNRLGELLRRFFPAMLGLGSIYTDAWMWDLFSLPKHFASRSACLRD